MADIQLVDGDYVAIEDGIWLTIGGRSVRVQLDRFKDVVCSIYRLGHEADEELASCWYTSTKKE